MKFIRNFNRSSFSFYLLSSVFVLTIIFLISCNEHNEISAPQPPNYFDNSLIRYGDYIHSSIPAFGVETNPMIAQQDRALIYWYNIAPSDVNVRDILGENIEVAPDKDNVEVLDIVFDPSKNGIYNNGELASDLKSNWGGLFRNLPDSIAQKFGKNNLVMKIWLKIVDAPSDAVLNIDLGKISEDIIPNGKLDTEDKNNNELLDDGEDTGIDGIADVLEPNYQNGNDPNNDDFDYQLGQGYEHVNGLENNGISIDHGRRPDTEDLNRNFSLDLSNDYFSYDITLDINKIVQNRIFEYGNNGWLLIKIPVELPDKKIGSPSVNNIESLRLWITNTDRQTHIRIAEIKFDQI